MIRKNFIYLLILFLLLNLIGPSIGFATEDLTAPTLEKVELEKSIINAGDSNTIYVTTKDENSGIQYVSIYAESPTGIHTYAANIWSIDSKGRWYGSIPINSYFEGGTWKIKSISITDNAGNTRYFSYGNDYIAEFEVESGDVDITPPTLEKVELEKSTINAGDSNTIYVTTKDDKSGIQYVSIYAESPTGIHTYAANIWSIDSKGRWYGSIPINRNYEGGTWKIKSISVTDNAGNTRYFSYGNDYIAEFEVESGDVDITPPTLEKVELEKSTINAGDSNTIYVTTKDDKSGIQYVSIYAESPTGIHTYAANIWSIDSKGRWYGSIPINRNYEGGTWKIKSISVTDNAGNTRYFSYGQDFTLEFNVISENKNVTLSVDQTSPQKIGTSINLKAVSKGITNPVYRFYIRDEKGALTTLQEYGSLGTVTWTPTKAGTYTIIAHAKDKSTQGSTYFYEARTEIEYKINEKVTNVKMSVDKTTPQEVGTPIIIKATSEGSANPAYRFFVRDEKGALTTLQEYGSLGTVTWTPTKAGTYTIIAHAKNKSTEGPANYYEARTEMVYKINEKTKSVKMSTDKLTPQVVGSSINIKAISEGITNPVYRFYIRDEKGTLTTLQEYGSLGTVTWTPTKAGTYTIIAHAKNKSSQGSTYYYEARTEIEYKINEKVTNVKMSTDKTPPQEVGTPINIKATSEGSANPAYRFFVRDEKGALITLQEYGSLGTVTWTPTKAGTYTIIAHAKNKSTEGPANYYEARTEMVYKINEKTKSVKISTDKITPQVLGSSINIKAISEGITNPVYRFYTRDEKGTLTTLQEYGSSETVTWTPTKPGTYTIIAHVKDKNMQGSTYFYEVRTEMVYGIK